MKHLKILYVEDEADIRDVARFALEDEGFELLICESGREAIHKAPDFKPDLLLLDVMMPEMDGPTTLQKIRQLAGMENIPVIFLTAKIHPNEVSEFIRLGSLDVIAKPFDPMQLANQIKMTWKSWHDR